MNQSKTDGSPDVTSGSSRESANNAPWAIGWAVVAGMGGGYVCGLAISRFGEIGSISLWALGALAGYVGRKIISVPSRLVGWVLVVACGAAFVIAEVCWIHWNTKQGAESWWTAFTLLPMFVQEYEIAALFGAILTVFGALSAYRQTAIRYRLVAVDE